MGSCMARVRGDRSTDPFPPNEQDQVLKKKPSKQRQQEFETEMPTKRQMEYWQRRRSKICGPKTEYISQRDMQKLFDYLNLSKETIKRLQQIFKNDKEILDNDSFFAGIRKFAASTNSQLASVIYSLYFQYQQKSTFLVQQFQRELKSFIKPNVINAKNGQAKDLVQILQSRKILQDSAQTQKYLLKSINFRKFKSHFLEGGLQSDQKQAYKSFCIDSYTFQSRLPGNNNIISSPLSQPASSQVMIINWRWCERMLKYMNQKYDVKGAPLTTMLKRKSSMDASLVIGLGSNVKRKESIDMAMRSGLHEQGLSIGGNFSHIGLRNRVSEQSPMLKSLEYDKKMQIIDRSYDGCYENIKSYPGEIDNLPLVGSFQWELKRNIRKDVDYVTIKEQTYEKLIMCFGGGPKLQRKTIQGYIELRPYFVLAYLFNDQNNLLQQELIKISSSDSVSSILTDKIKTNVCYHRNAGEEWQKFPSDNPSEKNKKVIDAFSETSFLIYMPFSFQKEFRKCYLDKQQQQIQGQQGTRRPTIGQIYQSKTYKIIDGGEREQKMQLLQVCIMDEPESGIVKFVVLNWSNHLPRRIPLSQFQQHFRIANNTVRNTFSGKKNRAGISNLGNTCYMNASLQAILSVCKDQYIAAPKGELGIELRQIARKMRDRKGVFPVDFKTVFDKHFQYFRGQDQHDAHQFCVCLFDQFQQDNKPLIQRILQIKVKQVNKCTKCQKITETVLPNFIVQLPLRDFEKKQVKIDYINDNKIIQTVVFNIEEGSTVADWKKSFQKISGIKDYFLCEIQNAVITRTFNKQDNIDNNLFKDMRIQNQFLITAYETKPVKSALKIIKQYDYRTYKDPQGIFLVARIQDDLSDNIDRSLRDTTVSNGSGRRLRVKLQAGNGFEQKTVKESELLPFPESYPVRDTYVKIVNYDMQYGQKFGRPFVFKIPNYFPISSIRQALQNCIGKIGYFLRACPLNEYAKCQICHKFNDNDPECFKKRQSFSPVCWVEGRIDFVAVWNDVSVYHSLVKRTKFTPTISRISQKIQDFDSFELSLKKSEQSQFLLVPKCDNCNYNNVQIQHREQIIKWPNVLILHLKRFTVQNRRIKKIHTKWKLEQVIFINKIKYILRAVLCHIGTSADYGHYVTIAGGARYDDELVTNMAYEAIPPEEIYMLFYLKADA